MTAMMTGDGIVRTNAATIVGIAGTIVGIAETIVGIADKNRRAFVTDWTGE